ncbi:MAG TPA: hypothetical protein VFN13_01260 [Rudaea sp.]|nr:hypothetical protein [Rudaea sp.]
MMFRKWRVWALVMVIIALVISGAIWLKSSKPLLQPSSRPDIKTSAKIKPDVQHASQFPEPSSLTANRKVREQRNAREVFIDSSLSIGKRFSILARKAEVGDQDAKHFALQIANDCAAVSRIPDDQPPVGQKKATSYQMQLRARMKASCAEVLSDPGFAEIKAILDHYSSDVLDGNMEFTIRQQFADAGPTAAINVAVSAISQRPDEATIGMIGDQLAKLDVSSIYLQPELSSINSVNPDQRNQLMRFALNLLACDYGRPCGPDSFVVQSTCTQLGACIPGANLQSVYQAQLLSGQQMADVLSLLAYLQQVKPSITWQ